MIRKVFVSNEEDEIAEFEADKNKDIEDDLPEDNTGAPDGWGAWTGAGIERDHKKEANIRRRREEKLKQLKSSRKDVNLKNVKINEKRDKKFKKYMVNELPHEYKSIAQFEQLMKVPLGKDWNTTQNYKRLLQPEVLTKAGKIIQPLKFKTGMSLKTVETLVENRKNPLRAAAKF